MDKKALRHKRNKSMIEFLWLINILDYLFYIIYEQDYKIIWPPVGLILCLALSIFYVKKMPSQYMMYLVLISIFGYTFYLNVAFPDLINYLFLYSGVIISAFYLSTGLLVFSSIAALLLLTIIYSINKNYTFDYKGYEDFPYFILFGIFLSTLLFILLRFTNALWNKAAENEQRAKKDLQSTKSYFESLFTYSRDAVCILDKQGYILEVNQAFERIFSYSHQNQEETAFTDFFANETHLLSDVIEKVKSGESFGDLELSRQSSTAGSSILAEATVSPIYGSQNDLIAIAAIIRDVTEKKLMDEYMRNSEKLKVTGEIAAGVAHEIRNPLTVIGGFIQMLREEDGPHKHYYSIIHSEINRMNSIISEFLNLAKPQIFDLKIQNMKELVEEVVLLFQSESNFKNVDIQLTCISEYVPILCEGNQLKQVFINLLKNSFEAMPDGGVINFHIKYKNCDAIQIIIEDNGIGIPDHVLRNVGKPFYTTKEDGTGLGFMITEKIIQQHKGTIHIQSEVGKGTRVQIIIPVT
ncbi:PAS domain S-box-containing protein [Peribacillus deserti]|uniref:histidine kinase n=1 Tax=Peribacillus deserti TaxID=673318 RepID=A0ABS2QJ16_9BACI|nr:ATP-binding protein [Peribacillus deserti]MBM7693148.1 PAS domain S-box-containing protein [Peribacillus deserti]